MNCNKRQEAGARLQAQIREGLGKELWEALESKERERERKMIIIKRTSWHYRFNGWMNSQFESYGMNLCRYFWKTVGSILQLLVIIGIILGAIGILTCACITDFWGIMIFLSPAGCVVLPILAISHLRKIYPKTEIPTPNILKEYIKAKKNKYCPMIDFQ